VARRSLQPAGLAENGCCQRVGRAAQGAPTAGDDEIAIVFCGSKKSLVGGIPMANVLFAGPALGRIVLPLMIFHQLQLMACAVLVRRYATAAVPLRRGGAMMEGPANQFPA
jgi:hypothetical protein